MFNSVVIPGDNPQVENAETTSNKTLSIVKSPVTSTSQVTTTTTPRLIDNTANARFTVPIEIARLLILTSRYPLI